MTNNSVRVITTLHSDGYKLYGKNIDSWSVFFPSDWKIDYYAEKHVPDFSNRVQVLDFNNHCFEWNNFYEHVKDLYEADTSTDYKRINWYKKALRWSFKMFVTLRALQTSKERYLIWLDADVLATSSPPEGWIEKCLNEKCVAGQLETIKAGGHIETGILIFDLHHPDIQKVKDWISLGYIQKQILKEEKAWDGIWMAKLLMAGDVEWNNLQMVIQNNTAKAFSDTSLKWLTHRVGKNKFKHTTISSRSGRSDSNELLKEKL